MTVWKQFTDLVEALCDFVYSITLFVMAMLLLVPLFNALQGRQGIGWILLTIAVMLGLSMALQAGFLPAVVKLIDFRKSEKLKFILAPWKHITGTLALVGACKLQYNLTHGIQLPPASEQLSWWDVILKFFGTF